MEWRGGEETPWFLHVPNRPLFSTDALFRDARLFSAEGPLAAPLTHHLLQQCVGGLPLSRDRTLQALYSLASSQWEEGGWLQHTLPSCLPDTEPARELLASLRQCGPQAADVPTFHLAVRRFVEDSRALLHCHWGGGDSATASSVKRG